LKYTMTITIDVRKLYDRLIKERIIQVDPWYLMKLLCLSSVEPAKRILRKMWLLGLAVPITNQTYALKLPEKW